MAQPRERGVKAPARFPLQLHDLGCVNDLPQLPVGRETDHPLAQDIHGEYVEAVRLIWAAPRAPALGALAQREDVIPTISLDMARLDLKTQGCAAWKNEEAIMPLVLVGWIYPLAQANKDAVDQKFSRAPKNLGVPTEVKHRCVGVGRQSLTGIADLGRTGRHSHAGKIEPYRSFPSLIRENARGACPLGMRASPARSGRQLRPEGAIAARPGAAEVFQRHHLLDELEVPSLHLPGPARDRITSRHHEKLLVVHEQIEEPPLCLIRPPIDQAAQSKSEFPQLAVFVARQVCGQDAQKPVLHRRQRGFRPVHRSAEPRAEDIPGHPSLDCLFRPDQVFHRAEEPVEAQRHRAVRHRDLARKAETMRGTGSCGIGREGAEGLVHHRVVSGLAGLVDPEEHRLLTHLTQVPDQRDFGGLSVVTASRIILVTIWIPRAISSTLSLARITAQ